MIRSPLPRGGKRGACKPDGARVPYRLEMGIFEIARRAKPMTYRGLVKDNVVILPSGVELPEGTEVSIEPIPPPDPNMPTLADHLGDLIGSIDGLPEDHALNHRHYRFGEPKR